MMEIIFRINQHEANLILKGLQELPAKESMMLIIKLQAEGQKQFEQKHEED